MEQGRKAKEVIRSGPVYQGTAAWNGKVTGTELCPEEQTEAGLEEQMDARDVQGRV